MDTHTTDMTLDPNGGVLRDFDQEMRTCIENCTQCHQICTQTIAHCLEMGGEHATAKHIGILMDCAQACALSADFMLRDSDLHPHTCGVCAKACIACAEDCERIAGDDEIMQLCAQMCRQCAETCSKMSQAH